MLPFLPSRFVTPAVIAIFMVLAILLARRPYYNWDMFPYMAVIMQSGEVPFDSTHRKVYKMAKELLPPADYEAISSRQPDLRDDPGKFQDIMKYFTIKPGYTRVASLLYRVGINPVMSTCLPSIVSYFLLGLLIYSWANQQAPALPSALFALVIGLAPPVLDLARYSSPDMICTVITTSGLLLVVQRRFYLGLTVMLASVWFRPDASILLVLTITCLAWGRFLHSRGAVAFVILTLLSVILIIKDLSLVEEYTLFGTSARNHFTAYAEGLGGLVRSYATPLIIIAGVTLYFQRKMKKPDLSSLLLMASAASIVVRYLLHPHAEDRFNLSAYLLIVLITWDLVAEKQYGQGQHHP